MYCNVLETYISFTEKNITEYLKMILEMNFDKKIVSDLVKAYIDSKYYGYNIDLANQKFSKEIFKNLKLKYESLLKKFPRKEAEITETFYLFKYIFYFEGLKKDKTTEQIAEEISQRRVKKYNYVTDNENAFKSELIKRVESDKSRRVEFLKQLDTDKFELIISKNHDFATFYDVELKHNIKFKEIFKEEAIENVFNSGMTAEDKLIVEYSLLAKQIANDILKGRFENTYFVEYTISLLKKKRKNKQILNIIDNQAALDKIVLKITYKQFMKNKYDIYDLMKKGFRFAVVVDSENNIDNTNLNMFKFILVTKEHPKLKKYMAKYKNVIATE